MSNPAFGIATVHSIITLAKKDQTLPISNPPPPPPQVKENEISPGTNPFLILFLLGADMQRLTAHNSVSLIYRHAVKENPWQNGDFEQSLLGSQQTRI